MNAKRTMKIGAQELKLLVFKILNPTRWLTTTFPSAFKSLSDITGCFQSPCTSCRGKLRVLLQGGLYTAFCHHSFWWCCYGYNKPCAVVSRCSRGLSFSAPLKQSVQTTWQTLRTSSCDKAMLCKSCCTRTHHCKRNWGHWDLRTLGG